MSCDSLFFFNFNMNLQSDYKRYLDAVHQAALSLDEAPPRILVNLTIDRDSPICLKIEVKGNRDILPLQTRYYQTLHSNIRLQNPTPVFLQKITPMSISSTEIEQEFFDFLKKHIIESRIKAKTLLPNRFRPFLELVLKNQYRLDDLFKLSEISQTIGKNLDQIQSLYLSKQERAIPQFIIKQQFKRYQGYFCPVCNLYMCSFHFSMRNQRLYIEQEPQEERYDVLEKEPYIDENYNTRYQPNLAALERSIESYDNTREKQVKCSDRSKCFRAQHYEVDITKLKKFQRYGIDHLRQYGFSNPCFMVKVLFHEKFSLTCQQIWKYLQTLSGPTPRPVIKGKKKQKKQSKNSLSHYEPCFHEGDCTDCDCVSCHAQCCCRGKCQNGRKGCDCIECGYDSRKQKSNCPCQNGQFECDPLVCRCQSCRNQNLREGRKRHLVLSKSLICAGLGLFAGEDFEPAEFVGEYPGNYLYLDAESHAVEMCDQIVGSYYLFEIDDTWQVDGTFFGNKTRFINHIGTTTGLANCRARVIFSEGRYRIAIETTKRIKIGQELLFDYGDKFKTDWLSGFQQIVDRFYKR